MRRDNAHPATQVLLRKRATLATFIAAFVVCESIGVWQPLAGIVMNIALLGCLVTAAIVVPQLQRTAVALAVLPLAVIAMAAIPLQDSIQRLVAFYSFLLVMAVIYRRLLPHDRPFRRSELGRDIKLRWIAACIGISAILGGIGFAVLFPHLSAQLPAWYMILAIVLLSAAAEELYFRGLLQEHATRTFTPDEALVLVASIYACFAAAFPSLFAIVIAFVLALLFSLLYASTYNLKLTFIANATTKLVFLGLIVAFT